jgi:dihydroneopterin aldolase
MKTPTPADENLLFITNLKVECLIGVYDWEHEVPQVVNFNLEFPAHGQAFRGDNLAETVDYKRVAKAVSHLASQSHYKLLESLAESVAHHCLQQFRLAWIRVRVDKPHALTNAATAGVEILRHAAPLE